MGWTNDYLSLSTQQLFNRQLNLAMHITLNFIFLIFILLFILYTEFLFK